MNIHITIKATGILFFFLMGFVTGLFSQACETYRFSFSPGKTPEGYTQALPSDGYTDDKGWGFDFCTRPVGIDRNSEDPRASGFCTSNKPFYFSVNLPEGNYTVKLSLGDLHGTSYTTVRAESRRLMLEKVKTDSGVIRECTFTVNVRTPEISGTGEKIKLNTRELNKLDWDNKLTLEFCDIRPCICTLEITPVEDVATVFLSGNSTVVDQDIDPWASWGQMIPRFFGQEVVIANHAESGQSLGSFINSNRLKKILSLMKKGDYLFIEFGHNDQKEKGPEDGAFKSYSQRLRYFVDETRKKGGMPVLVTPANRRTFDSEGKIANSLGEYPEAVREVAAALNVPLIDLHEMTKTLYETLGKDASTSAFVIYPANSFVGQTSPITDNTHFNTYGAYQLAKCIVQGIMQSQLQLVDYLTGDISDYDPAKPDPVDTFTWPLSPVVP